MDAAYAPSNQALLDSYKAINTYASIKVPALPSSIAQNYTSKLDSHKVS